MTGSSFFFDREFHFNAARMRAARDIIESKYSTLGEMLADAGIHTADDYNFENFPMDASENDSETYDSGSQTGLGLQKSPGFIFAQQYKENRSDNQQSDPKGSEWRQNEETAQGITYQHEREISCKHSDQDQDYWFTMCDQCLASKNASGDLQWWSSQRTSDRQCHSCAAFDHTVAARHRRGCGFVNAIEKVIE